MQTKISNYWLLGRVQIFAGRRLGAPTASGFIPNHAFWLSSPARPAHPEGLVGTNADASVLPAIEVFGMPRYKPLPKIQVHSQGVTAARPPGRAKGAFAGKLNQAASIIIWQPGQRVLRGQAGGFVTQWQAAPGELRHGRALPPPLDWPWGWRPAGKTGS